MREVISGKGSRFLLCEVSQTDPRFEKYPPQPIVRCLGWAKPDMPQSAKVTPASDTNAVT